MRARHSINDENKENKENLTYSFGHDFGSKSVPSHEFIGRKRANLEILSRMTKSLDNNDGFKPSFNQKCDKVMESYAEDLSAWQNDLNTIKNLQIPRFSDDNMTSLLAKFNAGIRALWSSNSDIIPEFDESISLKPCVDFSYNELIGSTSAKHGFIQCGTNIKSSIWTDNYDNHETTMDWSFVDSDLLPAGEKSSAPLSTNQNDIKMEMNDNSDSYSYLNISLNLLNHNSLDSNFMKVPHTNSSGPMPFNNKTPPKQLSDDWEENSLSENLLTSNKTHFRPIRNDDSDSINIPASQKYADGTTFKISNDMDEINFIRSSSGALYLGGFQQLKYKEYKTTAAGNHKLELECPSISQEFYPKYRVIQNEKFCQTDDADESVVSVLDVSCELENEFYFPDDEKLANDIINCLENESTAGPDDVPVPPL